VTRPLPAVLAALAGLVLSLAATGVASGEDTTEPGHFTGHDGVTYESAPAVVAGVGDDLFYGPDFDVACGYADRFVTAMERFAKVANVIRQSGRKVVWSMGLNKSTVLPGLLDPATFPQGSCDAVGFQKQRKAVLAYTDKSYLDLVEPLARSRRQVYFKTDVHWNTVGASVYARELARRLDPRLAKLQHYRYGTETRVGGFSTMQGLTTPEVSPTARPATRVEVRTKPGTAAWGGYPELTFDHSWNTRPARRTWAGRTLLLGDSYMMFALENLRPLFRHGRWMWEFHSTTEELTEAIAEADTVVLETYQNFMLFTDLGEPAFLRALKRALHDQVAP
jgi:hypothetical protein